MASASGEEAKAEVGETPAKTTEGFFLIKPESIGESTWLKSCRIQVKLIKEDQLQMELVHSQSLRRFLGVWTKWDLEEIGFHPRDSIDVYLEVIRAAFLVDKDIDATAVITTVKTSEPEGIADSAGTMAPGADAKSDAVFSECNAIMIRITERVRRDQYSYELTLIEELIMDVGKRHEQCIQQLREDVARLTQENESLKKKLARITQVRFCQFIGGSHRDKCVIWTEVSTKKMSTDKLCSIIDDGKRLRVECAGMYRLSGQFTYKTSSSLTKGLFKNADKIVGFRNGSGGYVSIPIIWLGWMDSGDTLTLTANSSYVTTEPYTYLNVELLGIED